jgi:SAM-dependent methyltransferase
MDDVARYNIERWRRLAEADALFTRPALDLDPASARQMLDQEGRLGDVAGKDVLCLAGGGGQQSVAFALLGARVTVLDISEEQLQRDRDVAAHYAVEIRTVQGDMRDLSALPEAAFDIVWHPYSLSFVPDARVVFQQVARVLRPGGLYRFDCANPFFAGLTERDWSGEGYALKRPYRDGAEVDYEDAAWVYDRAGLPGAPVQGPREYTHTLSTLVDGLVEQGFVIRHILEQMSLSPDPEAEPGTWDHFTAIAPPWLSFWTLRKL